MYQPNGDLHEGQFQNGRADGSGTYLTQTGSEMKGIYYNQYIFF